MNEVVDNRLAKASVYNIIVVIIVQLLYPAVGRKPQHTASTSADPLLFSAEWRPFCKDTISNVGPRVYVSILTISVSQLCRNVCLLLVSV